MKKAVWTLDSIGHIRQRSGLIVAGESEDMDGHGHGHGHRHGQGRTGGKKMRERLVRLTGEKTKVPTRRCKLAHPAAIQSQARAVMDQVLQE
jgi:hypothetical protein